VLRDDEVMQPLLWVLESRSFMCLGFRVVGSRVFIHLFKEGVRKSARTGRTGINYFLEACGGSGMTSNGRHTDFMTSCKLGGE
jgi:hypothetical protein